MAPDWPGRGGDGLPREGDGHLIASRIKLATTTGHRRSSRVAVMKKFLPLYRHLWGVKWSFLLGVICGALRLFADPEAAIGALNRYALYLAFPALIVAGLTDRSFREPDQPWLFAIPLVAMLVSAGLIRLLTPRASGQAGNRIGQQPASMGQRKLRGEDRGAVLRVCRAA